MGRRANASHAGKSWVEEGPFFKVGSLRDDVAGLAVVLRMDSLKQI